MFNKIYILILLVVFAFSQNIYAQKVGVALGTAQTNVEVGSGLESQAEGSLLGGALFYNSKSGDVMMQRVGILYSQKDFSLTNGSLKTNVSLSYLQVPLTLGYVVNPNFAFFGGVELNLNVG